MAALLLAVAAGRAPAGTSGSEALAMLPPVIGATERQLSDGWSGLGLSGYDPVGYLVEGRSRPGLARHEAVFGHVAWRFASAANRDAFMRDPRAFLPRIGGYDPVAAAAGRIAAADPLIFATLEGRLYLFRTEENRRRFLAEPASAEAAERGWSALRAGLVEG